MFDSKPRADLLALLAAAKADPDDDHPKLVLADWLQEQDHDADRARGEFVRAAVQYRRRKEDDLAAYDLYGRLTALWEHYHPAWLGPLTAAGFRLWNVSVPACVLLNPLIDGDRVVLRAARDLAASEAYAWVTGLRFDRMSTRQLAKFADSPLLDTLTTIVMEDCRLSPAGFASLATSPRAAGLRSLSLDSVPSSPAAVAGAPHLARLRELRLSRGHVTDSGFRALCDSPHLNELRSLAVTRDVLTVVGVGCFARRTGLPALAELDLSHNRLASEAALVLADSSGAASLRRLVLTGNRIGRRAVARLRERLGDRVVLDEPG